MTSRKSIAKQFQKWVFNVIKEIRLRGKYDLEEKLQEQQRLIDVKELEYQRQLEEKERELQEFREKKYEEIEKTGHLYVIQTDGGKKVGKTKDIVSKRLKSLQTGNVPCRLSTTSVKVEDIQILYDFPTSNADLLEKVVHYILDRYRCNSNREFFDCKTEYIIAIITICGKVIDTLKSSFQNISEVELLEKLSEQTIDLSVSPPKYEENEIEDVNNDNFNNWLHQNLKPREGSLLKLNEVCQVYSGKYNINTHESSKFKKEIENYIKLNCPLLKYNYGVVKIANKTYKGWKDICLK